MYILISDDGRVITKNSKSQYVPTIDKSKACTFKTVQEADSCKNTYLPKGLRKIFDSKVTEDTQINNTDCKELTTDEQVVVENVKTEYSSEITEWIDLINKINELPKRAVSRKKELDLLLEKYENDLCDIRHIRELSPSPLNAVSICKLHKLETKILKDRRQAKNERDIIDKVLTSTLPDVKEAVRFCNNIGNKVYAYRNPQIIKDIF